MEELDVLVAEAVFMVEREVGGEPQRRVGGGDRLVDDRDRDFFFRRGAGLALGRSGQSGEIERERQRAEHPARGHLPHSFLKKPSFSSSFMKRMSMKSSGFIVFACGSVLATSAGIVS